MTLFTNSFFGLINPRNQLFSIIQAQSRLRRCLMSVAQSHRNQRK